MGTRDLSILFIIFAAELKQVIEGQRWIIAYCCILQVQLLRNQENMTIFIPYLWHMAASFNENLAETTYSATGFLGISARGEAERWQKLKRCVDYFCNNRKGIIQCTFPVFCCT